MEFAPSRALSQIKHWFLPAGVILITLGVFAGTLILSRQQLGDEIREQILSRDAESLYAVMLNQQLNSEELGLWEFSINNQTDQFLIALEASRLRGVIITRLFDSDGNFFIAAPDMLAAPGNTLPTEWIERLKSLEPIGRFRANARLDAEYTSFPSNVDRNSRLPLLEIFVPIHAPDRFELAGIAQFLIDGTSVAAEFDALDANLNRQTGFAIAAGGALTLVALGWAFTRLQRTNRLLAHRTESLTKANHELALAAKTSAIGSVAAHLIHGLKNPLSGLQGFISTREDGDTPDNSEVEWQHARSVTQRMQRLVNDVVRVLQEDNQLVRYEITTGELIEIVGSKVGSSATAEGVEIVTELPVEITLSNRDANLILLILENLIQNAIQASGRGGRVTVRVQSAETHRITFEVADQGPGIAPEKVGALFQPCHSSKSGGSGIGLVISKQLASHLGAELKLTRNTPDGCVFSLTLPADLSLKNDTSSRDSALLSS